jgi:6-pyruvoyltetrahydropterin/6-carboxytetrahydropterin synthase
MSKVFITRRESFNAAHRMYNPQWDNEKNMEVYGKCSNPNWHGHNYKLFVTVKGDIDPKIGYVANLKIISKIINQHVIEHLDHKNINLEVEFMKGLVPSSENLAVAIWKQLEPHINMMGIALHCIKIEETENNFAEYYGE